jgi:hypothetical protein
MHREVTDGHRVLLKVKSAWDKGISMNRAPVNLLFYLQQLV